ncbi:MAG: hypothetical protein NTZ73_02615 [Candidatus Diapherotrites archaeon]|nr:hypothetical protein [Candidatus Diapherotrites archaeon]
MKIKVGVGQKRKTNRPTVKASRLKQSAVNPQFQKHLRFVRRRFRNAPEYERDFRRLWKKNPKEAVAALDSWVEY